MKQKLFLILLGVCFSLDGCKEKNEDASPVCTPDINFSTISVINENAEFVTSDPDDWAADDEWCDEIKNLFRTDTIYLDSTHADSVRVVGYPNPIFSSYQHLYIYSGQPCALQLAYVDHDNHVRVKWTFMTHAGYNSYAPLEYPEITSQLTVGQYYRLYYACHAKGALFFYKGHGDIYYQQ